MSSLPESHLRLLYSQQKTTGTSAELLSSSWDRCQVGGVMLQGLRFVLTGSKRNWWAIMFDAGA